MVASAEPPNLNRSAKPNRRGTAAPIDLMTRSKARNLYVVRQLPAQQVANETGLTLSQVYSLAHRDGWTKTKVQMREREQKLSIAREEKDIAELVEAVAIKSKVLSLGTLDTAITELATPGEFQAKNLQALSVAAKNFVGLYRQAKQLDQQAQQSQGSTTNIVFLGQLVRAERPTSPVEEASTVAARLAEQAIDVSASVVP